MSLNVSVTYIASRGLGGGMSVATFALLARAYGPTGYAEVALAIAAALFLASVAFGPLRAALARFFAADGDDPPALANVFYRIAAAIILLGLGCAGLWIRHAEVIVAAALLAVAQGAFDYAVQHATSAFAPRRVGLLYVTKSTLAMIAAIVILCLGAPAWCAVGSLALSGAIAVALHGSGALSHRWTRLATFGRDRLRKLAAFAAPLAVVAAFVFCAQWADRAVVGAQLGARSFGAYVAIADLTQQLLGMLFSGIGAAWYPRIVQASSEGNETEVDRLFLRYVTLTWALLVPAVVGLAAVAPSLSMVVFGAGFRIESGFWIPLLAVGAGFAGMKAFLIDLPLFLRKQMVLHAAIVVSAAVASTTLALLLVPSFGAQGAAAAYCTATLIGGVSSLVAGRSASRVLPDRRTFTGVFLGCAAMLTTTLTLVGPSVPQLVIAVGAGAAAHVAVLWLMNVSDARSASRRFSGLLRQR